MSWGETVLFSLILIVIGFAAGFLARYLYAKSKRKVAGKIAGDILEQAREEAEEYLRQAEIKAKAELLAAREVLENDTRKERNELKQLEKRLLKREDNLDRKSETLEEKEFRELVGV